VRTGTGPRAKHASLAQLRGVYALADDDPRWPHSPRAQIDAAIAGGASAVQLRLKHTPDRDALELARWAVQRARPCGVLVIVNDRFDLADLADADGVHLGQDDLAPERIPTEVRARRIVGLSTHDEDQMHRSLTAPVDYVAFGPIFGTASKDSPYTPRGIERLRRAVPAARRPLIAIGGIDAENIDAVARSGACAAAVISAIAAARDPQQATRDLADRFASAARGEG
jgi:thiamine-phosphate pyrophosphorylase